MPSYYDDPLSPVGMVPGTYGDDSADSREVEILPVSHAQMREAEYERQRRIDKADAKLSATMDRALRNERQRKQWEREDEEHRREESRQKVMGHLFSGNLGGVRQELKKGFGVDPGDIRMDKKSGRITVTPVQSNQGVMEVNGQRTEFKGPDVKKGARASYNDAEDFFRNGLAQLMYSQQWAEQHVQAPDKDRLVQSVDGSMHLFGNDGTLKRLHDEQGRPFRSPLKSKDGVSRTGMTRDRFIAEYAKALAATSIGMTPEEYHQAMIDGAHLWDTGIRGQPSEFLAQQGGMGMVPNDRISSPEAMGGPRVRGKVAPGPDVNNAPPIPGAQWSKKHNSWVVQRADGSWVKITAKKQ